MPASALSRIRARGPIGVRLGLGRMEALLSRLGSPQRQLRGVLIAGTNGKGSVSAMVAAMLAAAGYRTGQSPSPHLHSYRERVTIAGEPIGAPELDRLLEEVLAASEPAGAELGPATEFELLTAAAYLEAARRGVEVMVMEVGLGGRLDASNAWDPDVAAVTTVGLDHQEFLGDTLEAIAAEKAAIIRPGSIAVTGATGPPLEVIRARAASLAVPLTECAPLPVLASSRSGLLLRHERWGALRVSLLGRHQALNAAVALAVIDALAMAGVATVQEDAVREGLAATSWPGRLEIVEHEGTTIVLDGAHNPDGSAALAATLDELAPELPPGPATLVLGVLRDKEVDEMLRWLAGSAFLGSSQLVATRVPETARALPAADLAGAWQRVTGREAIIADDAGDALDRALALARGGGGPLVVAGSLYLVGHLRARLVAGVLVDDLA